MAASAVAGPVDNVDPESPYYEVLKDEHERFLSSSHIVGGSKTKPGELTYFGKFIY